MEILQYTPDMLSSLTQFYNHLTAKVPHCYLVKEEEFALAIQNLDSGDDLGCERKHKTEKMFIAIDDGKIKAFVHTFLSLKEENDEEDVGFIRFLGYERGSRSAGQAVLQKAEDYFKQCKTSRIFAFSQNDRYQFFILNMLTYPMHLTTFKDS